MDLGSLAPATSVGYAIFNSTGFRIFRPGRKHKIPAWFSDARVVEELEQKHLCGRTEAEKQRESDVRRFVLDRYFGDGQDAATVAKGLQAVVGHAVTPDAVEKLAQRLNARGEKSASRLGIWNDGRRPSRIGTKFITVEGHEICPLPECSAAFREVSVFEPHAAAFSFTCDTVQFDPFFQKQNHKDETAPRVRKSRGWTPDGDVLEPRGNPWRPARCIGLRDIDGLLGLRQPGHKVLRHHAEAREAVRLDAQVLDFIEAYNRVNQECFIKLGASSRFRGASSPSVPMDDRFFSIGEPVITAWGDDRTNKPVRLGKDKREHTPLTSLCGVSRFADLVAPVAQSGPSSFGSRGIENFVLEDDVTIQIYTGHACRVERTRIGLPLRSLSELTGISVSTLSAFELGGAMRLTEQLRDRIGEALEKVDTIRLKLLPAKIDLSDAAALRAALEAYERGDAPWFAERAVLPKLAEYVTF